MEFRLLGPMEVLVGSRPVGLGGRQRRTVLAVLLVHTGEGVSTDQLIDELWGESPPAGGRKTVQAHVAHLRRVLRDEGGEDVIAATDTGYVLTVDSGQVDSHRFEQLLDEAHRLRRVDPMESRDRFEEALGLFRGEPLVDLADSAFSLRVEASRLSELRLTASEDRLEAMIAAGRAHDAIPEARRLLSEHQLRERLWAILMHALYRSGRQAEALQAFSTARQTLAEELGLEPSAELRTLEQQILDQDPALEEERISIGVAAIQTSVVRNPYKGLRTFDEADASDFFGREALVRNMLERLTVRELPGRLLVLTGPSGAGKSSAVRAGLLPAVREGSLPGSGEWPIIDMFPGSSPFISLAKALTEVRDLGSPVDLANRLRGSPDESLLASELSEPSLLLIDQFEELFVLTEADERDEFLTLVAELVTRPGSDMNVIVTVRADFLDRLMAHAHLGPLLDRTLMLVPPLADHEIRSVITEPAARVGVSVEPDLVADLVHAVGSRSTTLPLLQFALADLFERRRGGTLTLDAYEAAGGISGGLSRRADEILHRFEPIEQDVARQLCLRLVAVTENALQARRRVTRDELDQLPVDEAVLERTLSELGRHRLVTFDQDPETGEPIVEIAHEALLEEWDQLRSWIDETRQDLRRYDRLTAAAGEWRRNDKDASYLLTGNRLAVMEEWADGTSLALTDEERRFLEESRGHADQEERQRTRRRRVLTGALGLAAVISMGFAVLALSQREQAQRQTEVAEIEAERAQQQTVLAEENERLARAREMAAASLANLNEDPQLSILLGLEAANITLETGGSMIREAREALHRAILENRLEMIIEPEETGVRSVAAVFSPDGSRLAVGSSDGVIRLYDPDNGALLDRFDVHDDEIIDVKWSTGGEMLLSVSLDATARLTDSGTGEAVRVLGPMGAPGLIGSLSLDGTRVAATASDGLYVWDLADPDDPWFEPFMLQVVGVAFDPVEGERLAVAVNGPMELGSGLKVYDVSSRAELLDVPLDDGVCELRWSPDGTRIATAANDTFGRVWDAETGDLLTSFGEHHAFLCTVDFSPDGTKVVTAGNDGAARVWDAESARQEIVLTGHEERVSFVSFSPDGRRVATSTVDASREVGKTRLWDVSPEGRREVFTVFDPTVVIRARFSGDGARFVTSSFTGVVSVWDSASGQLLAELSGHEGRVFGVDIDADGSTVVSGADDHTARVWDVSSGTEVARLDLIFPAVVAFHPTDGRVALWSAAQSLHLWDPASGEELTLAESVEVLGLAFSPDGRLLAVGSNETIRLWDLETGEELEPFLLAGLGFFGAGDLQFTADGSWLLVAHENAVVRMWDVEGRAEIRTYQGHRGLLWGVTLSPDENLVAGTAQYGAVRVWETETGRELLVLEDDAAFTSVDFSPDGRYLLVAGDFGARVHVVHEEDLIELARTRLLRWWTDGECFQFLQADECPPPPEWIDP